jgi:fatty acid synthase, animal type
MSSEKDPNDEIVISGISGRFPSSKNMHEFEYNLYNKVDMSDEDESRWKHFHPDVPRRSGKISNLDKYDAPFFGIMNKHANQMDPQLRILMEVSYEAIVDSGIAPAALVGSRTGVFIACSVNDAQQAFTYQVPSKKESGPG